mmetsp:Transcript_40883/g.46625  ORF Transcript_40883/g.46625 Transcript_40883/m.46625 type:complete len:419 (-) Transcript_40883:125-1381(-)
MVTISSSSSSKHHSGRHRLQKRSRYDPCDESSRKHSGFSDEERRRNSSKSMKTKKEEEREDLNCIRKRRSPNDYHSDGDNSYERNRDSTHYKDGRRGSRHRHVYRRSDKKQKKSNRNRNRNRHLDDDNNNDNYDHNYSDEDRSRDRKKSKKSKSQRKDKKRKASPKLDKSKLFPMGEPLGYKPDSTINADEDYFNYHQEFWIYLFREEGKFFNDIGNKESHAAFARFVKQYNGGKLEEPYYKRNFPHEVIEESKTTKHSWTFKTTHNERKGLGDLKKGVRRQTEYSSRDSNIHSNSNTNINSNGIDSGKKPVAKYFPYVQRQQTAKERPEKRHKELAGGSKDLKERRLEKNYENSARIHGAHKESEEEGVRRKDRTEELEPREKERTNNMLKMLGLGNLQGRKLEIAPRKDPPSNPTK